MYDKCHYFRYATCRPSSVGCNTAETTTMSGVSKSVCETSGLYCACVNADGQKECRQWNPLVEENCCTDPTGLGRTIQMPDEGVFFKDKNSCKDFSSQKMYKLCEASGLGPSRDGHYAWCSAVPSSFCHSYFWKSYNGVSEPTFKVIIFIKMFDLIFFSIFYIIQSIKTFYSPTQCCEEAAELYSTQFSDISVYTYEKCYTKSEWL